MSKENLLKAFKISVIILLSMAISILAILNWKSDLIIKKVLSSVQGELVDSLRYGDASLDLFSHFPSTTIQVTDLRLGSETHPLVSAGDIDLVLGLIPLLKGNILIHKLQVTNAAIHIKNKNGRWSYEILKAKEESGDTTALNTQIRELTLDQTTIHYDDGDALNFTLEIKESQLNGGLENEKLNLAIDLDSEVTSLNMNGYPLKAPFPSRLTGDYTFDMASGQQELKEWTLENEAIHLSADVTGLREKDHDVVDMEITWNKADLEALKKWLPEDMRRTWNQYRFSGSVEGQASIKGKSSTKVTPHITSRAQLKNGSIQFLASQEEIKGLDLDVSYDSGKNNKAGESIIRVMFKKDAVFGNALSGNIKIQNPDNPVLDLSINGSLPSGLLNLLGMDGLHFEKGTFDIREFSLNGFRPSSGFGYFMKNGKTALKANDLSFTYLHNQIILPEGSLELEGGKLTIDFDQFTWNKVTMDDLKGTVVSGEHQIEFNLRGNLCEGSVETKGSITGINQHPVSQATWKVTGIEMKKLLESFSNFDQAFITSDHLQGKTNIWATSVLPFDDKWNLLTKQVMIKSAIEIKDGRLQGMKTIEDFSDYVHLNDLQDIRFSQLRNYMKIENGIVYLPVMFIQSSALNLSIGGEHSFDQDILYYLKLNAGQVAANKLKKNEGRKDLKPARKSGWINMYFVLSGTTSNVNYQQIRVAVIAGFEQTTLMKEALRNDLVEKFGYDVYWLEPNEWEDIPEYQ